MSTLHHESILESIFEDVLSEYYHQLNAGDITQSELETIAQQRFNDLLQWQFFIILSSTSSPTDHENPPSCYYWCPTV